MSLAALVLWTSLAVASGQAPGGGNAAAPAAGAKQVPVVFEGGHETEGVDRGRPVILIAGALGVKPEVFREAFSRVHPAAPGTQPDPEEVRKNKKALMEALGKYGITNERLDEVSNRYRYRRESGKLWPTKDATGYAVVEKGAVTKIVVTEGGYGYSSAPKVKVPGVRDEAGKAELGFSKDFEKNGAVVSVR